jgi:hypothetical protein
MVRWTYHHWGIEIIMPTSGIRWRFPSDAHVAPSPICFLAKIAYVCSLPLPARRISTACALVVRVRECNFRGKRRVVRACAPLIKRAHISCRVISPRSKPCVPAGLGDGAALVVVVVGESVGRPPDGVVMPELRVEQRANRFTDSPKPS